VYSEKKSNQSIIAGTAGYAFEPYANYWNKYKSIYEDVCNDNDLVYTDTVIFGSGDEVRHSEHNRGVSGNYRVCISGWLGDD